jgi:tryptophan synthase alpha chain
MNGVREKVTRLNGRKLLVPFFTAGFPDMKTSLELVEVAEDCGCDIVELGMPFSDPLADGPEIQYSSKVALDGGTTLKGILRAVAHLRRQCRVPLVLMGYYNPIIAFGEGRFLRAAGRAGVDGLIIPDLPLSEAGNVAASAEKEDLSMIFLVAPTSTRERITQIDLASTDLVYAVTVAGVTGIGKHFPPDTDRYLLQLRRNLSKPFVAGFGVSSPGTARRLSRYADGVVIGSALVRLIRESRSRRDMIRRVRRFLRSIRNVL